LEKKITSVKFFSLRRFVIDECATEFVDTPLDKISRIEEALPHNNSQGNISIYNRFESLLEDVDHLRERIALHESNNISTTQITNN